MVGGCHKKRGQYDDSDDNHWALKPKFGAPFRIESERIISGGFDSRPKGKPLRMTPGPTRRRDDFGEDGKSIEKELVAV